MSKTPPVPEDQRNPHGGASPPSKHPEVKQDPAGGNADVNLREQGRYGGIGQNITPGQQQDR